MFGAKLIAPMTRAIATIIVVLDKMNAAIPRLSLLWRNSCIVRTTRTNHRETDTPTDMAPKTIPDALLNIRERVAGFEPAVVTLEACHVTVEHHTRIGAS